MYPPHIVSPNLIPPRDKRKIFICIILILYLYRVAVPLHDFPIIFPLFSLFIELFFYHELDWQELCLEQAMLKLPEKLTAPRDYILFVKDSC